MKRGYFIGAFAFLMICISQVFCDDRYIRTPNTLEETVSEEKTVFLAGSAASRWRDRFKQMMAKDNVILIDPINFDNREPDRSLSLMWEIEHIGKADILLAWIPPGIKSNPHTLSLTTLFELGRFTEMKDKPLIVGISRDHHMANELTHQVSLLRPDAVVVHTLEDLATQLRKSTNGGE